MNGVLTAMWQIGPMAAISGIEAIGAHHQAPQRDQREGRAAVEYGAAVTHRDLVQEKLRVDPAALAEKKRESRASRRDDEPEDPRQRSAHSSEGRGRHVDISV
jgi:hypothetical protein